MKKVSIFAVAFTFCMAAGGYVHAQTTGQQGQTTPRAVNDRVKPYYNDSNGKDYPKPSGNGGTIVPASKPSVTPAPPANSGMGQKKSVPAPAVNNHKTKPAY